MTDTPNLQGMSTRELFSAAARQLNEEAKAIDAKRNREPASKAVQQSFAQLTADQKKKAAFGGGDAAELLAKQSGGPGETPAIEPPRHRQVDALFSQAFAKRKEPEPAPATEPAQEELTAPPIASGDDRKRLPEADATLFDQLQLRLQAPPAAPAELPPDAAMRRALHGLTGPDRERIEERMQAESFLPGYFAARGFDPAYRTTLTADALAQRLKDARRLDDSITPESLLQRMLERG